MKIDSKIEVNKKLIGALLDVDKNFDILLREISICGRTSVMYFIDSFTKDEILEKVYEFFLSVDNESFLKSPESFMKNCIPYTELELSDETDRITVGVLSGMLALMIDGFDKCILIDTRTYPQRGTAEPDKDKVLRGSKDGFVETMVFNIALIRRRIRTPQFRAEAISLGESSHTDIALCYIKGRADENLVNKIRTALTNAKVDALTLNQESVAEVLVPKKWYNPFPKFKYSERPDTTAAQILEGDVCVLVDNSPSAMLLPVNFFDVAEDANDYYFPPVTGTYLRFIRYITLIVSLFLTPVWLLLMKNEYLIPTWLDFIKLSEPPNVPLFVQLIILELAIDGIRLASLNTPTMLTTTLSLMGAIVVGDFAVQTGWFSSETMLYMAFVALVTYSQPGYELSYALKFMRLIMIIATGIFNIPGFIISLILVFTIMISNKTISGKPYMYPLIPLNLRKLKNKLIKTRAKKA